MPQQPEEPKSLEMRVAALEDKLAKVYFSEEEMKTYQKVATALGVIAARGPLIVRQCSSLCICGCGGGCLPGGGTPTAGGFGGFGH